MLLVIFEIIIGIVLIASILLQSQGGGLSTAFGGSGESYRSKRSIEKLLAWVTIIASVIFAILSFLLLLLPHR